MNEEEDDYATIESLKEHLRMATGLLATICDEAEIDVARTTLNFTDAKTGKEYGRLPVVSMLERWMEVSK